MNKNLIPKKIHYIWLGGKELSPLAKKCIESWKKHCPDYEIVRWDERNVDISKNKFMKQAYDRKKWGFVTDVLRLEIIYNEGGIYLDTDVEIIKNFDSLLSNEAFIGFEGQEFVNTGSGFGAKKKSNIIKQIWSIYDNLEFVKNDSDCALITTPILITQYLFEKGLKKNGEQQNIGGLEVYPEDFFNPKNPITRFLNITDNTFSIHHFDASWTDEQEKKHIESLDKNASDLMKQQSKKVSIIIPVFNGEKFLKKAIDSALNQTYKNVEVIVINDGSTDNTEFIAKSYGSQIRYFFKQNGGVASALNLGISKMRGNYFSWLSHDDMYYPNKIEKQVKFANNYGDDILIASNWTIIDREDKIIENKHISKKIEMDLASFLTFDRKTWLNGCSLLISKKIIDDIGLFDEELKSTQDYDYFFRISKKYKTKIIEDHLLYSRAHPDQGCLTIPTALRDSDIIHSKLIQSLDNKRIFEYFDNDIDNLIDSFHSFRNNGYKRMPSFIMKFILNYYNDNEEQKITELVNEKILGFSKDYYHINSLNDLNKTICFKKNKPRLIFCSGHWFTGGVERVISILLEEISQKYDVFLITPYTEIKSEIGISNNVAHIKISDSQYKNDLDYVLFSLCILFDVDIVIGFMNLSEKMLDFYDIAKDFDIKTIASNHEHYLYPYKNKYYNYKLVEKRLNVYKNVDVVFWLTNYSTQLYNSINKNGITIPNPNSFNAQEISVIEKKDNIILCVGRFYDYVKRVDRMLKVFSLVLKEIPDAKLMLVGKFDMKSTFLPNCASIESLMLELKLSDEQVIFVGEQKDMKKHYSEASVMLSTSISEGFPMTFNEAGVFGVPVVCMDIMGIEDIITNEKNGFILPQDNIEGVASKIVLLLKDDKLRNVMSESAKTMSNRFTREKIIKQWMFIIDGLLNLKSKKDNKLITAFNKTNGKDNYEAFFRNTFIEMHDIYVQASINQNDNCLLNNNVEIIVNNNSKNEAGVIPKKRNNITIKAKRNFLMFIDTLRDEGIRAAIFKAKNKIIRKINKKN